jgi:hypothetical protein
MRRAWLCVALVCSLVGLGCGGSEFTSAPGGGADGGIDSNVPADASGGPDRITPRDGPIGFETGPGEGSAGCGTCTDTQYCNPVTGRCTDCSDLSRLEFGPPDIILPVSNGPGNDQIFPRVGVTANQVEAMVYEYTDTVSTNTELASTTAWTTTQGTELPTSINNSLQSGPLLLPPGTSLFGATADPGSALLLYDNPASGKSQIWSASAGTSGGTIALLQGNINVTGSENSHVAVALGAPNGGRVWWVTSRSIGPALIQGLVTMPLNNASAPVVNVPLDGDNGCHCTDLDVEPWVTPDGSVLFFSCVENDPASGCNTTLDNGHKHLYRTSLDPSTGLQVPGTTAAISAANLLGHDDRTPSLSPNMCSLYFSSARRTTNFDILVSRRQ